MIAGADLRLQGPEGRQWEDVAGALYAWKMSMRMLTGTRAMATAPATPGSTTAMSRHWSVTPGDAGECPALFGQVYYLHGSGLLDVVLLKFFCVHPC